MLSSAPAVDAGEELDAPVIDIERRLRTAPWDLGAFEHGASPATNLNYRSWQADWFLHEPSAGTPAAMPLQDGMPNLFKYLFNINPLFSFDTLEYSSLLRPSVEYVNGIPHLVWNLRVNASAPDVRYAVESCSNLLLQDWQSLDPDVVQMLYREPVTGDKTLALKFDGSMASGKFLRLKASLDFQ